VTGPSAASKSAGVVVGDRTAIRDGVWLRDFEQVKRQILDRVGIQDVVAEHVTLKRRGARWVGLCPFHSEKTPSFTVSPERGLFKCFGGGKGGGRLSGCPEGSVGNAGRAQPDRPCQAKCVGAGVFSLEPGARVARSWGE